MPVSNHLDIVETINKLRAASHAAKIPVIFTRLCYKEDYSDAGVQMEELPQVKEPRGFVSGTWDADVLDEVAPNTTQGEILLCTGVGSNVCVESTVRDGAARDFYCKTPSDATATLTMEDQNARMKNLAWFGGVTSADDVLRASKQRQENARCHVLHAPCLNAIKI
ncbi:Isochorismatase-like protein [Diaporthe sp. PMI_573]|nr:Isochorismatase-like protein [Diaporthaceae sp. PMI_573]